MRPSAHPSFGGNPGEIGLDPRLKHSGVTVTAQRYLLIHLHLAASDFNRFLLMGGHTDGY
jgi:hypothetical protein